LIKNNCYVPILFKAVDITCYLEKIGRKPEIPDWCLRQLTDELMIIRLISLLTGKLIFEQAANAPVLKTTSGCQSD